MSKQSISSDRRTAYIDLFVNHCRYMHLREMFALWSTLHGRYQQRVDLVMPSII